MTRPLPKEFLRFPIAHRALHDLAGGRPENSREAVKGAIAAGYAIEIDVQLSADGSAMVFHDYELGRLTAEKGAVRQKSSLDLERIRLRGGPSGIPTLRSVLSLVAGRVPVLIEIKDQDGALGSSVGDLEKAVAESLDGYLGPIAVMSFNPHSIRAFANEAAHIPRGLTTCRFALKNWPLIPAVTRRRLRDIPDFEDLGCSFISHDRRDLENPRVSVLKKAGTPVLCWTIRSKTEEDAARKVADNVTFEGYNASFPSA